VRLDQQAIAATDESVANLLAQHTRELSILVEVVEERWLLTYTSRDVLSHSADGNDGSVVALEELGLLGRLADESALAVYHDLEQHSAHDR